MNRLTRAVLLLFFLTSFVAKPLYAQEYEIDISKPAVRATSKLQMSGKSPSGEALEVNNQFFLKNGQPWLPLMGEMHYNRVPAEQWENEILKMKSLGLSIVASYVFWNEHEPAKDQWDWKANRDLRKFIALCGKHHMYFWLRVGPWSHGEQLHGGFPDRIQAMKGKRTNDPAYMAEAARFFRQIGQQTRDLYFRDGGPIIGVQLENEYASGEQTHISRLKELALQSEIAPVYWTVTANTVFDDARMDVIPLQGSYPYRGWEKAGGGPTKDFLYGDDQWIMTDALGKVFYDNTKFPRGLCEQGCGSQMTYANRFVVQPEIVEAHLQNQIGRGMNLIGYYMFHGGTQTPGLQEESCPLSYDFQSPLSEFGLLRPSARSLKILHAFINDFGQDLAPMQVYEPQNPVRDERDSIRLRYVARANGDHGYLFLGNAQVRVNMPDKEVAMKVKLPGETIQFPSVLLKGQSTAILPFNMKAGAATIKYVTAQPLAKLVDGKQVTLFFMQLPGVEVQLALDAATVTKQNFTGWQSKPENGQLKLKAVNSHDLNLTDTAGQTIRMVFLTRQQAENAWRARINDKDVMLISESDLLIQDGKITLSQIDKPEFNVKVYPKSANIFKSQIPDANDRANPLFDSYTIKTKPYTSAVKVSFPQKQTAVIQVPEKLPAHVQDIIISVDYLGGSCNLAQHERTLTDNLFNGTTWHIGLDRYLGKGDVTLDIQDWDPNTTGVPQHFVNEILQNGKSFKNISSKPKYQTVLDLKH